MPVFTSVSTSIMTGAQQVETVDNEALEVEATQSVLPLAVNSVVLKESCMSSSDEIAVRRGLAAEVQLAGMITTVLFFRLTSKPL